MTARFCTWCGTQLPEEERFCTACGKEVQNKTETRDPDARASVVSAPSRPMPPTVPPLTAEASQPVTSVTPPDQPDQTKTPGWLRRHLLLVSVIVVVAVAMVAVGAVLLSKNAGDQAGPSAAGSTSSATTTTAPSGSGDTSANLKADAGPARCISDWNADPSTRSLFNNNGLQLLGSATSAPASVGLFGRPELNICLVSVFGSDIVRQFRKTPSEPEWEYWFETTSAALVGDEATPNAQISAEGVLGAANQTPPSAASPPTTGDRCIDSWNSWIAGGGTKYRYAITHGPTTVLIGAPTGRPCGALFCCSKGEAGTPDGGIFGPSSVSFREVAPDEWAFTTGQLAPIASGNATINADGSLSPLQASAGPTSSATTTAQSGSDTPATTTNSGTGASTAGSTSSATTTPAPSGSGGTSTDLSAPGFVSPSGNIACAYRDNFFIDCYVRSSRTLAWVNASGKGRDAGIERGVDPPARLATLRGPVLQYGSVWKAPNGGITCFSLPTQMRCENDYGTDTGFVATREAVTMLGAQPSTATEGTTKEGVPSKAGSPGYLQPSAPSSASSPKPSTARSQPPSDTSGYFAPAPTQSSP
jgi:hypothetical protein